MTCEKFLARYSEYLDDRMTLPEAARWRAHIRECDDCARYHRVVERGQELVRELPRVQPSADFEMRLRQRLAAVDEELENRRRDPRPSTLAALSIAALLALVAWSPMLQQRVASPEVELPAMQARAPMPRIAPNGPGVAPFGSALRSSAVRVWRARTGRGTRPVLLPAPRSVRVPSPGTVGAGSALGRFFFDGPALLRTDRPGLGIRSVGLPSPDR